MSFEGVVVLITGVSGGIGYTLANILHEYGATVIGVYYQNPLKDVLFDTYKCDISREQDVQELFNYLKDKHEKLDVVVNCAALCLDNDIFDKNIDEFMQVLKINLGGTFLINKYAAKLMNRGIIINLSSTDATDTYNPLSLDYSASKAGVENLTKNLALRFPKLKICALAPNWVNTPAVLNMNPEYLKSEMERIGQKKLLKKEDVAFKIIEIMINDDYVSGDVIRMDGRSNE